MATALDETDQAAPASHDGPPPQKDLIRRMRRNDAVLSFLQAASTVVLVLVLALTGVWLANRVWGSPIEPKGIEIIEMSGEEGKSGDDPFLGDDALESELPPIDEVLEQDLNTEMVEDIAAVLQETSFADQSKALAGVGGSAGGEGDSGTGAGAGGIPPHMRWSVRYGEGDTLKSYGRQLDFFGIQLGVLKGTDQLTYVEGLSSDNPKVRKGSGAGEGRLYFVWRDKGRRRADVDLLKKAGVQGSTADTIVHFYPDELEAQLKALELAHKGLPVQKIRQTTFQVEPDGNGFRFVVVSQAEVGDDE